MLSESYLQISAHNISVWEKYLSEERSYSHLYDDYKEQIQNEEKLKRKVGELELQCKIMERQLKTEKKLRIDAESRIEELTESLNEMQKRYRKIPPEIFLDTYYFMRRVIKSDNCNKYKIDYYDAVVNTDGLYTIEETAKLCSSDKFVIGRNQLYDWLMNNGYISAQNKLPYQKYIENGVFRVCLCNKENEETDNCIGVFVTSDGLKYLYAELSKSANEFKIK